MQEQRCTVKSDQHQTQSLKIVCVSLLSGLPILKEEEKHLALASQLASCITDKRAQHLVRHSLEKILMTRIVRICLGYESVNDCNRNRHEPIMQYAVKEIFDEDICSSSTMCRLGNRYFSSCLDQYNHYRTW